MNAFSHSGDQDDAIIIVGGGVIGLAIGWQLLRASHPVTVIERDQAGRSASWMAAGMLAPHSEVGFEDEDILRLSIDSLRLYPRFLDELAEDSDERILLDDRGTLIVGFNRDDTERMRRLFDFRRQLELPVTWLAAGEAREMEPLLSPRVTAAIHLPDDSQVNNRHLIRALTKAFVKRGGVLVEDTEVAAIKIDNGRITGLRTTADEHTATRVVMAAGCWSNQIDGIPKPQRPPVRPVKGQIVSLRRGPDCDLGHVVRAPDCYLLPKDDGRLLVGATQEEMGFDMTPTAGSVLRLLERGWEAVPSIFDLAIESIDVGLRPGSLDHRPIIGESAVGNLFYATGHFRHGIILAPITAYAVSRLLTDGEIGENIRPFAPSRFVRQSG